MVNMKAKDRIDSTPEKVSYVEGRMAECLCWFHTEGGKRQHGIVHKVFAARNYDGIRCLVASDDGVFSYHDVLEVDAH